MLPYSQFFLTRCNRMATHIGNPRIFNISNFSLPKQVCHHYIGGATEDDIGPTQSNPLYKEIKMLMPLYNITETTSKLGNPIVKTVQIIPKLKLHIRRNNRKFRYCLSLDQVQPLPLLPLVVNYSMCDVRYKYVGNLIRAQYYKAYNKLSTFIDGVLTIEKQFGNYYNHFLFVDTPNASELSPVSEMRRAANKFEIMHFSRYNSFNKLLIFELWKLVGLNKEKSIFNKLDKNTLDRFNVVFLYNNVYTVFNLGKVLDWRASDENPKGIKQPFELSKLFLKSILLLIRSSKDSSLVELTEEEIDEKVNDKIDDGIEDKNDSFGNSNIKENIETKNKEDIKDDKIEDEEYDASANDDLRKQIEENNDNEDIDEIIDILRSDDDINKNDDIDFMSIIIDEEDTPLTAEEIEKDKEQNKAKSTKTNKVSNITTREIDTDNVLEEDEDSITEEIREIEKTEVTDALNIRKIPIEKKEPLINKTNKIKTPEEKAKESLDNVIKQSPMSVSKYDAFRKSSTKYKSIKLDKNKNTTVKELLEFKEGEINFTEEELKNNKTTTQLMDKKYIDKYMEKDIASMIVNVQSNGALIQDISRKTVSNISGESDYYTVKIKPIEGESSTLKIRVPKLEEDGTFKIGAKRYSLSKQRRSLPIVKINDSTVSLTSYFGKTFVRRDSTRVFNYEKWLISNIRANVSKEDTAIIKETRSANVFDNSLKVPSIYSLLSKYFKAITTNTCFIYLDYSKARERFNDLLVDSCIKNNLTFIGVYNKKLALGVDEDNIFYYLDPTGNKTELGTIEDICGLDLAKAPTESINIEIMGKEIPIGLILAYKLGLSKLINNLDLKYYRTVPVKSRAHLEPHEYYIRFNDYNLILSKKDRLGSLILSGLSKCNDTTKNHSIYLLDKPEIYFTVLEGIKIPGRYTKEIDLYYNMFIDPITERILLDMDEPNDFGSLLVRACELLLTRYHPDETDTAYQRIAGYDRIPGEIYTQLVKAMREHNRHGIKANYPIEMNPEAVWLAIATDTIKQPTERLNPLQDIKQRNSVTYAGNGGRSKVSLTKEKRNYHKNSVGIISESSVDSGDSGNRVYLSANPKFKNIYGVPSHATDNVNIKELEAENTMSSVAMMVPFIDTDDPKRIQFSSVQQSHSISANNYKVMPCRTGYDEKLLNQCSDSFATVADIDGVVKEVSKFSIIVQNKDGSTKYVDLTRRYGDSGDFHVPLDMVTDFKVGDKVKQGDVIAYSPKWFTKDPMFKGKVAYKGYTLCKVALMENSYTFEDSIAISKEFSNETTVDNTYIKQVIVNFEQGIQDIKYPGAKISIDESLCFIEDKLTNDAGMFDDESINLLSNINKMSPRSPVNGTVDSIEVIYNGDKEDMSESLLKLVNTTDRLLITKLKSTGKEIYTGDSSDDVVSINGNRLMPDTAVITFYITSRSSISTGDKIVVGSQLKATIAKVFTDAPRLNKNDNTPGEVIDAIFSTKSVNNRIVNSAYLQGMTNRLLVEGSKKVAELYFKNK